MVEVKVPDIGDFDAVPVIELFVKVGDRIEVDEAKRARQVAEVTETEFFSQLQTQAKTLRQRRSGRGESPTP